MSHLQSHLSSQKQSLYDQQQDQYFLQQQEQLRNELNSTNFANDQVSRTTNLPVQDHIMKLEVMLTELVGDLEISKKQMTVMRGDMLNIEYLEAENNQGISQLIQDETIRVSKQFRKEQEQQKIEYKNFLEQIKEVRQDRKEITNKANLIEHRVFESENNVGFKEAYAMKEDNQY